MSRHTICLIPGDGIGPEVASATRQVIEAAGVEVEWIELPAGAAAVQTHGDVLPPVTIEAIEQHRLALKGPVTTPVGKGFSSVNVQMRKRFNLYAAVRFLRAAATAGLRALPGVLEEGLAIGGDRQVRMAPLDQSAAARVQVSDMGQLDALGLKEVPDQVRAPIAAPHNTNIDGSLHCFHKR